MGKVFFAGALGMFAVTLAISFAAPLKDDRPLGDDSINFNPNERKLEEPASPEGTPAFRSGNQVITVTKRGGRLVIDGSGNHVVNGNVNDGVTLSGSARLAVHGSVQSGITVSGSSRLSIDRDVQGGATVSGSENVSVGGNVQGGITSSGSRTMNVRGDVYGNIIATGSSILTVQGRHLGGSVTKGGSAQVHIRRH